MLLHPDEWHYGYEQILHDCRSVSSSTPGSGGTVWIYCGLDADAMCATRIFTYMLRSDGISYLLKPCPTRSTLAPHTGGGGGEDGGSSLEGVKAVVLMNVGASLNLSKWTSDASDSSVNVNYKVYVIDHHRPCHLANIYADRNVVIFSEEMEEEDDVPSDGDFLGGSEEEEGESDSDSDSDSDDSDDSDGEKDDESVDGSVDGGDNDNKRKIEDGAPLEQPPSKRFQAEDGDGDGDEDGDGDDERDDSVAGSTSAASKTSKHKTDSSAKQDNDKEQGGIGDDDTLTTVEHHPSSHPSSPSPTAPSTPPKTILTPSDPAHAPHTNAAPPPNLTQLLQDRQKRISLYYARGSYHGPPSSFILFSISTQLRFSSHPDLLWLACVGLTDALVHHRIDALGYEELRMEYTRHVDRLYPNDVISRSSTAIFAEDGDGKHSTRVSTTENGRILADDEFRFFALRHWSLYDAMLYSNFVSTKLQIHKPGGVQRLQELLARMGFPLDDCRQPFAFLRPSLKRRLRRMVGLYAKEYGLEDGEGGIQYRGFLRVTGYKSLVSAQDVSHAITALLESSQGQSPTPQEELVSFHHAYDALHSKATVGGAAGPEEGSDLSNLVNGGEVPYQAATGGKLLTTPTPGLGAGIQLAISLQKSILSTAFSLVERNAIIRLNHFRYAYLHCQKHSSSGSSSASSKSAPQDSSSATAPIFARPLALGRLAKYLMELHRENGKWVGIKSRPLILLAEQPALAADTPANTAKNPPSRNSSSSNSSYLVVGYNNCDTTGIERNRFGRSFRLAAKSLMESTRRRQEEQEDDDDDNDEEKQKRAEEAEAAKFRFESFDTNVVQVDGESVQRFMEQLHFIMDYST
eukprot:CAMPEP_0194406978 /NCGR_PEP_ID=MMETSP0176-20130528/5038_1 /TAXON_ID=216777 /ORGANISM="Proboscia alata, Strain PI-D3" /LENGTH=858 /DNA_ID=CAMNT_0039206365 /DNA_START=274 /DNA_END=2850 /DNA_ORIENTATION=-